MNKKLSFSTIILIFVFMLSANVRAETFFAYLTSAQEVPPNASTATGYARIFVNETTMTFSFTLVFNGLSSNQVASHIHAPAAIGANAGVAIGLGAVGGTSGTVTGSNIAITPTQLAQIRAHQGYVNVHTTNFGGGEIRGQLGIKRPVDFDGDGRNDFGILRFPTGPPRPITYWNANSTSGVQIQNWGEATTDFPAPGDYDGDGRDDLAIYRAGAAGAQSEFWIYRSSDNVPQRIFFGLGGDQAVNRDYDGDGITDLAVFRPGAGAGAQAFWWIRRSTVGLTTVGMDRVVPFGTTGDGINNFDTPVPGDYDGDGKFDLAVYRFALTPANNFIVLRSSDGVTTYQPFGNFASDWILPGDYDGDGKYDLAVARTGAVSTSPLVWWILQSSTGTTRNQPFGISSDVPAQGDYDGDARTDIAVCRRGAAAATPNIFWVFRSFDNTAQPTTWGVGADFPINIFDAR